jgi:hypothetical protein
MMSQMDFTYVESEREDLISRPFFVELFALGGIISNHQRTRI